MTVSAEGVLDGLLKNGDLANEDGLIQDFSFSSEGGQQATIITMAAISYDYKEAASSIKFYSDRLNNMTGGNEEPKEIYEQHHGNEI